MESVDIEPSQTNKPIPPESRYSLESFKIDKDISLVEAEIFLFQLTSFISNKLKKLLIYFLKLEIGFLNS